MKIALIISVVVIGCLSAYIWWANGKNNDFQHQAIYDKASDNHALLVENNAILRDNNKVLNDNNAMLKALMKIAQNAGQMHDN